MASAFFALATATRSMLATYVGVIGFLVLYFVLTSIFDKPQYDHIVGLLEPLGAGAVQETTKYWTASDRNAMLPPLQGVILENRLIWFSLSFVLLALAYGIFNFRAQGSKRPPKTHAIEAPPAPHVGPLPAPHYDGASTRAQFWRWTRFELGQVFKSPAFFVLLALGLLNSLGSLWTADEARDFMVFPVTRIMINGLIGAFTLIPVIIGIYYAGELVWRERDKRTHEVIDACPVPDWIFVVPKIAAITLVLFATYLVSVLVAIGIQAIKGYTNFEIDHYVLWYVVPQAIWTIELAAFAIFVQAVSPHKYVGWGIMVLYLVARVSLNNLGFEHRLYQFAPTIIPFSDMNGQGKFWIKEVWLQVYWGALMLMLAVLAYGLWRRGSETRLSPRLARLPRRLSGAAGLTMVLALLAAVSSGGFIYYNTNVLNEYRTSVTDDDYKANYEKTLLHFQTVPQPRLTDVALNVAIYPHDIRVETTGRYMLENRSGKPLDAVHLRWDRNLQMRAISVDGGHLAKDFGAFHYEIFAFDKPMAPGERRAVHFRSVLEQRGFKNSHDLTTVVDNGTFVNNFDIAPAIGIDLQGPFLSDPSKRRRHGLPAQLRPKKLEDDSHAPTTI